MSLIATRQALLYRRGLAPQGEDTKETFNTPDYSAPQFGKNGATDGISLIGALNSFPLLPAAAVAAGTDAYGIATGTGTEVIARSTTGGANFKTQASTPADNDNVLYAGVATTVFALGITASAGLRFQAALNIGSTAFATMFASFGITENVTDPDPTSSSGDGVVFLYDPTGEVTTGLAVGTRANWIMAYKVLGADTFADTGVVVVAGQDYDLKILSQTDLTCKAYIDGTLVGTSPALTTSTVLKVFMGAELTATPAGQADFTARFVQMTRNIG